jgi:hypothetical protein
MPDGCPGIRACDVDMITCVYKGTGSINCPGCGTGGKRACTVNGPGPCQLTTTCSQGCGTGSQSCTDGAWTACTGCSGQVRYCNACQPTVIADTCTSDCRSTNPTCALPEICNGCDDNVDGYIDNQPGVAAANTLKQSCTGPSPECTGASTCVGGVFQPCTYSGSKSCTNWCGDATSQTCNASTGVLGACPQRTEVCNGLDDNCDGQIDEASVCQQGTGPCTVPPCGDGICAPGETSTSCPADCH